MQRLADEAEKKERERAEQRAAAAKREADKAAFEDEARRLGEMGLRGEAPREEVVALFKDERFGCEDLAGYDSFGLVEVEAAMDSGLCSAAQQEELDALVEADWDLEAERSKAWSVGTMLWPAVDMCLPLGGFVLYDRILTVMGENPDLGECDLAKLEVVRSRFREVVGIAE